VEGSGLPVDGAGVETTHLYDLELGRSTIHHCGFVVKLQILAKKPHWLVEKMIASFLL
jgi:hypothetical protein